MRAADGIADSQLPEHARAGPGNFPPDSSGREIQFHLNGGDQIQGAVQPDAQQH